MVVGKDPSVPVNWSGLVWPRTIGVLAPRPGTSGPTESSQGTYVVSVDGSRKLTQVWKLSLIVYGRYTVCAVNCYRSSTLLGGDCECAGTYSDVQLLSQIDRAAPLIDSSRTFPTQRNGEAKQENPDSSPDLDPVDGKLYANVQFRLTG